MTLHERKRGNMIIGEKHPFSVPTT